MDQKIFSCPLFDISHAAGRCYGAELDIGHANSLPLQSGLSISTASSFGAVRGFVMCLTPEKK
jgi:hypothetical protein